MYWAEHFIEWKKRLSVLYGGVSSQTEIIDPNSKVIMC